MRINISPCVLHLLAIVLSLGAPNDEVVDSRSIIFDLINAATEKLFCCIYNWPFRMKLWYIWGCLMYMTC